MARDARYTRQMPFVGTEDQYGLVEAAEERARDSKAAVVRLGLNLLFNLDHTESVVGSTPQEREQDIERRVTRAMEILRNPAKYRIVEVEQAPVA